MYFLPTTCTLDNPKHAAQISNAPLSVEIFSKSLNVSSWLENNRFEAISAAIASLSNQRNKERSDTTLISTVLPE
jgi:hypothetical protein